MEVNVSSLKYTVELITEGGGNFILNEALLSLHWEEQVSELSMRATITVANMAIGNSFLIDFAHMNRIINVYAEWGAGGHAQTFLQSIVDRDNTVSYLDYSEASPNITRLKVFSGTIWDWNYLSETQKELTLTCYDPFIRMQRSKDFFYFQKGMTTQQLIGHICDEWGISLSYEWSEYMTHEKKVFSGQAISDMIFELLEEVRRHSEQKYIALYRDGTLVITSYGRNSEVYRFDFLNTISTNNKFTMNGLVTRVKIIGKQDNEGRAPVEDIIDGDTSFGVLQEVIRRDSNKTLEAVRNEATELINDRGRPQETILVQGPDLPFLRKGDAVEMAAGNLLGRFYVEAVSHVAENRQMTMTLSRTDRIG